MCGTLLYGDPTLNTSACSNNKFGPPMDRDGNQLPNPESAEAVGKQPPCFLRWSPSVFAKELPEVFEHNPDNNRLRLKKGAKAPWLRECCPENTTDRWAYCADCYDQWHRSSGKRLRGHITYRDKASQGKVKSARPEPTGDPLPDQPAAQPAALDATDDPIEDGDVDVEMDADEHVGDDDQPEGIVVDTTVEDVAGRMDEDDGGVYPDDVLATLAAPEQKPPKLPTLKEYKKKWDQQYALHARSPKGNFSHTNLSPNIVPQLWQNCPWVPFDILTADTASDEAHARLSRCVLLLRQRCWPFACSPVSHASLPK